MTKVPRRYNVTLTVGRDGDRLPNPAEFAVTAKEAASARAAAVVSAHTTEKIISVVTLDATDQRTAVAVALAVVSEALKRPVVVAIR